MDPETIAKKRRELRREGLDVDKHNLCDAIDKYRLAVCQAISNHQMGQNNSFFEDQIINNAPIETTGPFAGYTALHIACMNGNEEFIRLLVEDYHANVNAVADDGAQPIHFACLFELVMPEKLIDILLGAGANVDAEIGEKLFTIYIKNDKWCNDFGNKMTLLTFSILYANNDSFVISLIEGKANLKVKSLKNKTLLMYAIENQNKTIVSSLIKEVHDHEWINARDSDGYTAAHYRLHKHKIENDPNFDKHNLLYCFFDDLRSAELIHELLNAGADVNATVNDDPNTLLLNIAARKHYPCTLDKLLAYHDNISKSMALHYSLCPLKSSQTTFDIIKQKASIILTLKDLIHRRTFGLFVPEDEKILMDKLIAEDIHFRELAHTYEQNIIQGKLKTEVLKYDDKSITYYDFIMSCFDDKKLHLIVKNKSLLDAFENIFPNPDLPSPVLDDVFDLHINSSYAVKVFYTADYFFFRKKISNRIEKTSRRLEQLEALRKVENLRKAIPLPYELT
ncbi:Similar to RF_0381: Putative ankyrin repeat protein RF_0381 (Rickettsia felis (strain ATCC VR-1525 / URRWXCal2)) [Cotesia congregata]|uniref:Similar to RF_0381: Putative ankyrin repeat protein RF_0381 (Rickettsia felis (Strain ATCC VR-1525 / URRWXCal2)) n=1 Tax=Cotesia congregata TaxID=51543 RepID=A0A8J2H9P6_COTCN|nr:Similar to RF_0381: Putative ankyrin repeat protein RF_0381 (Rickettsia felis (strain ATCC VR-1525 / URRWXCal2)) [Cotesia congregata]